MKYSSDRSAISRAGEADIPAITALIEQAVARMRGLGIDQWDAAYPGEPIIRRDIIEGSLYKITVENTLAGIIVLNEEQAPQYSSLSWPDGRNPLIVHRMCVRPDCQGNGLAKRLMKFAEEVARAGGCTSIRLDTYSGNYIMVGLLKSLDYRPVGDVSLREGKNFHCFLKIIR